MGIQHYPIAKNFEIHELIECYLQIKNYRRAVDVETALDLYVKLPILFENDGFDV